MLAPLLPQDELFALLQTIKNSHRIVVCAHRSPDGDAVGSTLGWADYLQSLGKTVNVILPNPFPDFLRWLPNSQTVKFYKNHEATCTDIINQADLIFCLDLNCLERLQEMENVVRKAKATKIIIDHHINPDRTVAKQVISFPEMCATCEIVFRLIHQLGGFNDMTQHGATCLYTGMMTDTGGFTYNSSEPEIYEIISLLLTKQIDKDKIYRNVNNVYSVSRIRLVGYVLKEKLRFYANNKASIYTLTREEQEKFCFKRGDAEGLVNMPLQVKGMRLSISLREDTDKDIVRVSLRSVDDFPCNKMAAEFFNGGGHFNASGGELPFPLSEAVATAERAIEAYSDLL